MVQDLISLDLNVCGLTLCTTQRLMNHDAAVGKAVALALRDGEGGSEAHAKGRMGVV